MKCASALVGAAAGVALVTAPLSSASAHGRHGSGLLFGLAVLGTAAVVGAATLATAPARALAAPAYAPPAYAYAPPSYAYAPPAYPYARAPAYVVAPAPVYAAPPGYPYVR